MELGMYSFGETVADPSSGERISPQERMREILEEAALAEAVGLDVYGVGEHHRADWAIASPPVVLAAAAARTSRIRLTSAVTVLSSADPVRVFEDFTALDLVSGGRAEIMAGRGSFTESFPLYGFDLADYDELFDEKLRLLIALGESETVTWRGRHRPALQGQSIHPRPVQRRIPVSVAVGGTPASAVRAGQLGLPLALAVTGGDVRRSAPLADLYRQAWAASGHPLGAARVSVNAHGFVARSRREAVETTWPARAVAMTQLLGIPAGRVPSRAMYEDDFRLTGGIVGGSPDEVIEKILYQRELLGADRFLLQLSVGTLPHRDVMRSIELYGTEVAPALRRATAAALAR